MAARGGGGVHVPGLVGDRAATVRLVRRGGCAGTLTATVGERRLAAHVPRDGTTPGGLLGLRVPGRGGVVAVRSDAAGGGSQWRLYGYAGGRFDEIRAGGTSPIPFAATDTVSDTGSSAPVQVRCDARGLVVSEGGPKPDRPERWQVVRTTYAVTGLRATLTSRALSVHEDPPRAQGRAFAGCSPTGPGAQAPAPAAPVR